MKVFFAIMGVLVIALWIAAIAFKPASPYGDKKVLYWSTDPNPARTEQLAPFEKLHPDVKVAVEPNTFEKTIVQCSTGLGPDIIEIYSVADMVAYAEAGILLDLTPYQDKYGFGPSTTYPGLSDALTFRGKQYAYPANVASQVLMYNKKKFAEAGIPEPTSGMLWDDFIKLVKPLTVAREGGKGFDQFAMVMGRGYATDIHIQYGATFFNEDGTRCVLDSPKSLAAVQFYIDLMKKYQVIPTPDAAAALSGEGGWGQGEIRWFATGRAACIWGSRWMMVQFRQYPDLRRDIGVVLLPHPEGGVPSSRFAGRTPAINANTKNKELALEFISYLASDEYSEVIAQDSDALPPNRDYAKNESKLLNPDYPWETYQDVFVQSMEYARPIDISPFVGPKFVERVWLETLEIVENGLATPEDALKQVTKRINDQIQHNLDEQPDLRREYDARIAREKSVADAAH